MWFSLGSSLLPRSAMMQGIVGALSFAFGYGVGVFVWMLVKIVARRFGRDLSSEPAWVKSVLAGVFVAILLVAILRWPSWQSDQRQMVGLDDIGLSAGLFAALWMIALTGVLLFLGTSIRWVVWKLDVFNARHMSPHVARGVTALILVGIGALLVGFFTGGGLAAFANERFAPGDNTTLEGITQPQNAEVSGSPGSVVDWDDLGFQGRTFTGAATTSEDIDAFYSDDTTALSPIRVYAGLKSADSPDDRAQLVVDELIRTNAQDRALLVLVATTGTGWVDPLSAATVEYMYKGDTAIAAMQYSFLPSWISFILDTATAIESGVAINDAVIEWWQTLPEDGRPKLIAFGESLGSLGSEAAYGQDDLDSTLAYIQSRVDGAFWVGPTNANEVHGQLVEGRDPSPVWRPDYDAGLVVRSANGLGEIDPLDADWAEPRVLYYHHASDPVGYWNWETLWTPQEWSQDPIGADVPDSVRWVPFTTFTQVVVDLINGFSASVGHGHNYNDIFVEGWSIVAPREGWTAADTQRLQDHLESLDVPGL
jgi:uncharacterized membrane protein